MSIGIIGLGSFGKLIATLAPENVTVLGYDEKVADVPGIKSASFDKVAQTDVLFLAIPLAAYEPVLTSLQPILRPETLVVDICSVKMKPTELLKKCLPGHKNLLVTHPLFGPQSAAPGDTKGRQLIVTEKRGELAEKVVAFCQNVLELDVQHTTAKEHDRAMAQVHALTFFVARGLAKAGAGKDVAFTTPSFQSLRNLVALDESHSSGLFDTIQMGNPYAAAARLELLNQLQTVENELKEKR